jgi:membrane protease YdiL (CAAX protease family)
VHESDPSVLPAPEERPGAGVDGTVPGVPGPGVPPGGPTGGGLHPYAKVAMYVVGYFVAGVIVSFVLAIVAGIVVSTGLIEPPDIDPALMSMNIEELLEAIEPYLFHLVILTGLYTIGYTWLFVRVVDKRKLRSLGLELRPGWTTDFAKGAGLAVLILAAIFAFSLVTGAIRVEGFARPAPEGANVATYLLGAIVAFLIVGIYEELMFRGYILQRLNERAGRIASILVSSILFAVLHGANPGADAFGIFNTTVIAVILSVLYFRTRSLWMPIGFHFAWNFFLGHVYSLPVSGMPVHGVLNVVEVDPASRITGGSYGPEAGVACTIALVAWGAWLVWKRTAGRAR